ncbi:MAG: Calx-beta domain-containing protein [Arenimonas sp.]
MVKHTRIASSRVVLVLLVAIAAPAPTFAASKLIAAMPVIGKSAAAQPVEQIIVRYKAAATAQGAITYEALLAGIGRRQGVELTLHHDVASGGDLVRIDHALDAVDGQRLFAALRADPRIEVARVHDRLHPAMVPNDFLYVLQWNLGVEQGIRMPPAWDVATGNGVRVAVLDTGIVGHPDLDANIVAGYDFVSDAWDARDGDGRDANPTDPGDGVITNQCPGELTRPSSWHGTRMAGAIAAVTNNGDGIAGVAFGAKVVPVRVTGMCGNKVADIADAITWASGGTVAGVPPIASPVEVIALGMLGFGGCDPVLQSAIDGAVAKGVVVVAAAGNYNVDAANSYPGSCANVITVGAISRIGERAGYSNHGPLVDVMAPGGTGGQFDFGFGVYTTSNYGTTTVGEPGTPEDRGTSVAMAQVAGVAALMQGVKVNTPAVVEAILKRTAFPMLFDCPQGCGAGVVDASIAVRAAAHPVVFITATVDVAEGDSGTHAVEFRVRLSQPLGVPLAFDIATANGTAIAGDDYVARSATAQVIPAGQTSYDFSVVVNGDNVAEANEDFHVELANVVGAALATPRSTTQILTDDCFPLANGVARTGLAGAAGSAACYEIAVPAYATGLTFVTTGGGGGADMYVRAYELPDTRGGYWDWDCAAATCNFGTPQPATYFVVLKGRSAYAGVTLKASYTPTPPPQLSVADVSIFEGNAGTKFLAFTVQLSKTTHAGVSFDVATSDLQATAGSDYVALALAGVVIPSGHGSRVIGVEIPGDTGIEANESFRFDLVNVVGATVVDAQAIGTLLNDDGPLLRVGDVAVAEGDAGSKLATLTVSINTASADPVEFDIATRDATATAGSDYVALALAGEAIPAGQLAKTFSVTILGDTMIEGTERIALDLRAVSGATAIDDEGYIDILNDDGPTLSILDATVREGTYGSTVMPVTVRLSKAATVDVSYQLWIIAGTANSSDIYSLDTIYATIPAGSTSRVHQLYINPDANVEPDETFAMELRVVTGATRFDWRGIGTILNDDGPALIVRDATVTEGDSGTRTATFVVSLSQALQVPISYTIASSDGTAIAGSDYTARTLVGETIPAGMLSRTFSVVVNGDTALEGDETFNARVSAVSAGATAWNPVGTGTIINDDGPALSVLDASVAEGNSGTRTMNVTVRLSQPASVPVTYSIATVAGAAQAGSDYQQLALTNQVIAAGETIRMHAITINGDTDREGNESFQVNLGAVGGATRADWNAIATIYNDDGPTLSVNDASISEGNSGAKVATFTVSLSQAETGPISYSISTFDLSATAGSDYEARTLINEIIPAGMLTRTFSVTINGDTAPEGQEAFLVAVSYPGGGATLFRNRGTGTIINDD